jgi:signal peptidase II
MFQGEQIPVIKNWFYLLFTENKGFAFGIEFAGRTGKIFLTLFRVFAATLIKRGFPQGFILCLSLIFVGASGNIIDSIFYGLIFNYDSLFHGAVVDMFYFPLIKGHYPDWVPVFGGRNFIFFRPVFNIADAAITTGVLSILVFHRKTLKKI